MKRTNILNSIREEVDALKGDASKDKTYSSQRTFDDEKCAQEAFVLSKTRLFAVNTWSDLSSFTADFMLHDSLGNLATYQQPQVGDYIRIKLPVGLPENWVKVIQVTSEPDFAEFTVKPCGHPKEESTSEKTDHFFQSQASSTFRVERKERTITAFEIGRNETINNHDPESGDRALINTLIAEVGWLFHQPVQWTILTDYLVLADS